MPCLSPDERLPTDEAAGAHGLDPDFDAELDSDLDNWWAAAYPCLVETARRMLARERAAAGVTPGDVVHELYLRLAHPGGPRPGDRRIVAMYAGRVMRQVLIDQQRRRSVRRTGALDSGGSALEERDPVDPLERMALEEALASLRARHPVRYRLLHLRFFRGLTLAECALRMELSSATLKREMALARTWLLRRL